MGAHRVKLHTLSHAKPSQLHHITHVALRSAATCRGGPLGIERNHAKSCHGCGYAGGMDTRARQDALVGYLRSRASATAEQAAEHFGVSVRTLHRDLAMLRERDVPIESEPGRGGGIRLDPARALVPIRLSLDEVVGLLLVVSLSRRAANIPFGRAAQHAMDKVLASLPEARARSLKRTLQRVVVGGPASSAVVASLGAVPPVVLEAFERGFSEQRACHTIAPSTVCSTHPSPRSQTRTSRASDASMGIQMRSRLAASGCARTCAAPALRGASSST